MDWINDHSQGRWQALFPGSHRAQITPFFLDVNKLGLKGFNGFSNYITTPLSMNNFYGVKKREKELYWVKVGKGGE